MKRKHFIVISLWLAFMSANAQQLAMNKQVQETKTTKSVQTTRHSFELVSYGNIPVRHNTFEENHFLGDEVSEKWNTFLVNYTHEYDTEVGLSNSQVEIRKPSIYNGVTRANKYLRKQLQKGSISKEYAKEKIKHILDCANVAIYENDTKELEQTIAQARTGEDVISVFDCVKLLME